MADHRQGSLSNSNIHTGRRSTRFQLKRVVKMWVLVKSGLLVLTHEEHMGIQTHTRGSKEGSRELVVSGYISDLCGDVDQSTNHRRDPVEAQ